MVKKISTSDRVGQLSAAALDDGYKFVGFVGEYKNSKSRAIFNCVKHGDWTSSVGGFYHKGDRCRACACEVRGIQTRMPREVCESKITALMSQSNLSFIGWDCEYLGMFSRMTINCSRHGDWSTTPNTFINKGRRCPDCGDKKLSRDEREVQLTTLALIDGYEFIGWDGDYIDSRSRVIMSCVTHGEWQVAIRGFVRDSNRCPGCAKSGYNPSNPGTLYALLSHDGKMIKIGISNSPTKRHLVLRRNTPFKFSVHRELPNADGSVPLTLEKLFHDQFPSAGLTGFDGATEWRQMSPDVTTWLDLLQ